MEESRFKINMSTFCFNVIYQFGSHIILFSEMGKPKNKKKPNMTGSEAEVYFVCTVPAYFHVKYVSVQNVMGSSILTRGF